MVRFPNPGSDISAFIRTFQALFKALGTQSDFSLDDMSKALVGCNLATSSGHIGKEALRRSTRIQRSLDPLFNQSKMYSELFRIMGWMHPTPASKQRFVFSYIGAHVATADNEPTQLVKECLLGIAYPNPYVEIKGEDRVRPIPLILRTAHQLNGRITRDEIILGPMDIGDDRQTSTINNMNGRLLRLRDNRAAAIQALMDKAKQLKIQINTLHNYTRFPLGVIRWAGWTKPERDTGLFDVLSSEGIRLAEELGNYYDVRAIDLTNFTSTEIDAFIQLAGYESPPKLDSLESQCTTILTKLRIKNTKLILFSPFQEWNPNDIERLYPSVQSASVTVTEAGTGTSAVRPGRPLMGETGHVRLEAADIGQAHGNKYPDVIARIEKRCGSEVQDLEAIIEQVMMEYTGTAKDSFYPAVEEILSYLGFPCEGSRVGVNYQRMDALIADDKESIPVEIKSPAEQQFISVKGVRQALENKIVLTARKYCKAEWDTTSLVVGYELPPNRSEVANLVDDIYDAYKITIGIVDFRSLIRLTLLKLLQNREPKPDDLRRLRGIIQINDT